jgi:CRISPR-associated protein Cas4
MEQYIQISKINDFLYCPRSVYLHSIYENFNSKTFHKTPQVVGKINHSSIDEGRYSSAKKYLQGMPVYSEKYGIAGKIDIYDSEKKTLTERKTMIKKVWQKIAVFRIRDKKQ